MKQSNRLQIRVVMVLIASIVAGALPCMPASGQQVGPGPTSGYTIGSPYGTVQNGPAYGTGNAYSGGAAPIPNGVPQNNLGYGPAAAVGPQSYPAQPYAAQPIAPQQYVPPQYAPQQYAPQPYASQPIAPPTYNNQPVPPPGPLQTAPSLEEPWKLNGSKLLDGSPYGGYDPRIRDIPVDVYVQEAQTGRFFRWGVGKQRLRPCW